MAGTQEGAGVTTLDGRRILVTGASSGIGAAIARACAAEGAAVACVARRKDRIEDLATRIGGIAVPADLTDDDHARAAVARAAEELGGLDGVVNNAGVMLLAPVATGDPADWRRMFDLNVLALLVVTQAALPHLRAAIDQGGGHGDIVNISSMAGRRVAGASGGVYAGTKFAVHAISEGLRQEVHRDGVRVVVISPGFVETELGAGISHTPTRERVARMQREIGLEPGAVARQVVRALSEPPNVLLTEIALLPTAQD